MNSRQRVEAALNHEQPDYVPLDLGASAVTGMHVSSVYKLRQALGLDPPGTPVKVVEPYQMLGEIAADLQEVLGVDVVGLGGRRNMFGFENAGWKPWTTFDGTPVLVPERFNTVPDANGDILLYPEGDTSVRPSGRMPKGGFYFDSITRQEPIDEDTLRVEDNLEEFGPVSDADLQYFASEAQRLRAESDRAILANFGGTAFGDIALVPAPWLKQPKGIRDVAEWYMSTAARVDFVYSVFERQCEIGLANLAKIHDAVGDRVSVVFVTGTDFGTQAGPFINPKSYRSLYQPFHSPHQRLGPRAYQLEDFHPFLRLDRGPGRRFHRRRLRYPQSGAVFGRGHGSADAEGQVRFSDHLLGWRGRYAEDASLRHAGRGPPRGPAADRDFQPRRRFRFQHGSQRAGGHAHGEPAGALRDGEGVAAVVDLQCGQVLYCRESRVVRLGNLTSPWFIVL